MLAGANVPSGIGFAYAIDLAHEPQRDGPFTCWMLATDRLTSFKAVFPLATPSAGDVQRALSQFFSIVGTPAIVSHDGGSEFKSSVRVALETAGVTVVVSTPYNKTGNSVAERAIRTIRELSDRIGDAAGTPAAWATHIHQAIEVSNAMPSPVSGLAPSAIFFGRRTDLPRFSPQTNEDLFFQSDEQRKRFLAYAAPILDANCLDRFAHLAPALVEANRERHATRMQRYREEHGPGRVFAVGDLVLVRRRDVAIAGKFVDKKSWPPREVAEVTDGHSHYLRGADGSPDYGRPYRADQLDGFYGTLEPTTELALHDLGTPAFLVHSVKGVRRNGKTVLVEFLTRWQNFSAKYDTWEPVSSFTPFRDRGLVHDMTRRVEAAGFPVPPALRAAFAKSSKNVVA
jgi:hypothetical protein